MLSSLHGTLIYCLVDLLNECSKNQPWIFCLWSLWHPVPFPSQGGLLFQRLGQQYDHFQFFGTLLNGESHSPYFQVDWLAGRSRVRVRHCLGIHLQSCDAVGSVWHPSRPPLTSHEDLDKNGPHAVYSNCLISHNTERRPDEFEWMGAIKYIKRGFKSFWDRMVMKLYFWMRKQ